MTRLQPGRKAIAEPIEIGEIRPLSRSDLAVLAEPRPANALQNLRDNHHRIARAIASGMSNGEVAEFCGISYNRVNILRNDPAMTDLIAHYRSIITAEWATTADPVIGFLRSNALKAQAMISDKLDSAAENNEFLPTRDLLGIAEIGLDRTGYGKERKNVNVNMDFAAMLEKARARSANVDSARVINSEIGSSPHAIQSDPVVPPAPTAQLRQGPSFPRALRRF